jgi:hypothetical protein
MTSTTSTMRSRTTRRTARSLALTLAAAAAATVAATGLGLGPSVAQADPGTPSCRSDQRDDTRPAGGVVVFRKGTNFGIVQVSGTWGLADQMMESVAKVAVDRLA